LLHVFMVAHAAALPSHASLDPLFVPQWYESESPGGKLRPVVV
jgi:hypothetical protein